MGGKLVKRISGMNGWAKGALVTALTLAVSIFMYQGWFTPNIIDSATNTYRFAVDTTTVNLGTTIPVNAADGSTSTTALTSSNPTTPVGKYSLTVSSSYTATGYIAVPGTATNGGVNDLAALYGPVYNANTVITAPVVRLAVRAGSTTAGQLTAFTAKVYDYDPSGSAGNGTLIWTGAGNGASTSTANLNLSFGTTNAYTITHGHRLKILVSATNNSATAGRLYFYSSSTISSYLTVTENFPTSTTSVLNLTDYNNGSVSGITQGQQNVAMLSFQISTNATSSTSWTGGKLDKIGTNGNADDVTFTIYRDSNNDGAFDPSVDTKISDEVSFSQASGQGYTLVTPQNITTTAQRYFVVYNLSPAAAPATTIGAQILDESYFTVSTNNVNPMLSGASSMISVVAASTAVQKTYQVDFNSGTTYTTPLPAVGVTASNTSCSTTATSYSTNVYGLLNYPSHTCTAPATTNYNTLTTGGSITLYFNGAGYGTALDKLQGGSFTFFGATGTSGTASTLKASLFYVTPAGAKVAFPADATESLSLGTSTTLASKTITFSAANYNVSSVPRGSRLGMTLTATGASARLALNSAAGAKLIVSETASANNGVDVGDGKVITDASVTAGSTGKVVDAFTLVAGSSQIVTSLTISGANTTPTNISSVKIYRDLPDGSGAYGTLGAEDGAPIATGSFSGSSAVITTNESVGTTMVRYLVVYDIAATAVVGQKITGLVTSVGGATADYLADTSSAGLTVVASTVVTEGAGEPATVSVAPGGAAVKLDAFGLSTNGPSDTINTVTVQLPTGTSGAVATMEIIDRASSAVYGSSTAPIASDTWRLTVTGLFATSATTQCYIRITPKGSIAGTYSITGQVTAITHVQTSNVIYYNDAASATVVIDGIAPPNPALTAATGSAPGEIKLDWSSVVDSNPFDSGVTYKLVRGSANAPAPSDCSSGTSVYQGAALGVVDQTGLTDGHNYTFGYRVCALDGVGNRGNGSMATAAVKLPKICNQTPTLSFTTSPNQYARTGGAVDYSLNIINNDIGDCPPVAFTVTLDGSYNDTGFVRPVLAPATPGRSDTATVVLGPNGGGSDVEIHIAAADSASQGDAETFVVKTSASGYAGQAKESLVATINNFGPMLHSSFSVGTKYGTWGGRSTCNDCHINTWENTKNIKLISENVLTPLGRKPVVFSKTSSSTATSGIFGNEQRPLQSASTNICEVCHHNTKFHQYSAANQQTDRSHHNGADCMACHPHKGGFKYAGGAVDCISCHGNPPTSKVEMVSPPTNALGGNPTDWGAHARHNNLQITCDACHNNYTKTKMGNRDLEMGFNVNGASFANFGGVVTNGTITVGSTYNTYYNWTSKSPGTRVVKSDNQSVPSCSIYCHGGWSGGGGTNTNPTWVGNYQAACGTCHNFTNANPLTTGSHQKHVMSGNFLENGVQVGGLGLACTNCHGSFANYTGVNGASHINGSVQWNLGAIAADATYRGSVSGGTGNIAPSASYGACGNLYCHSNVQGATGTGLPTSYQTPTWGGSAHCGSCHVDMYSDAAATGGHKQHAQASQNFAVPFDCRICHGNGGTTNPQNHANKTINMDFSGYGANTVYSNGNNVAPGTAYGSCSTSDCHGRRTITWGPSSPLPLCEKCHGSRTSVGGFYATSGPGTAASNTDPIVGAHNAHIHQTKSAFTLYTSYSAYKDCSECHVKPSGPYDAGHIDTALPAEVVFQPGAIANRAIYYGFSGAKGATYSASTCNNIWCHGAAMDSNVGRGAYANVVADGGTLGSPQAPVWNSPMLNGVPANDCTRCHSYPPPGPNETYTHFSHYSTINGVDVAQLKKPNECNACHINVKSDGSGFINSATHINGTVDKGCNACHGVPPATVAALAIQSNGALASGQAGAHTAHADLPVIGKNCVVCHNGYTSTMPSQTLEMGFNALGGKVTTGAFWGYSTLNNGLTTFVSSSPGTVVYQTNTQTEQNSCAVYCHGLKADGSQLIGGRFGATAKPVWDSGAGMVCGNCHGVNIRSSLAYAGYTSALHVRPDSAPTSSSHPKHASPTGLNLTCDTCHGVITNFTHVNGSVAWNLDTANSRVGGNATYNGSAIGATGNLAPSASYGSCNNIYCHSSGQSVDGGSSIPVYASQQWGTTTLTCTSCHADMVITGTGSHTFHTSASGGSYTCINCHGAGYTPTPGSITATTHVDQKINVSLTAGYAKGASFAPGAGYQSCTNNCHGQGTPVWGTALHSSVQCQKCHADLNSAVFYSTSYPTKVTSATDSHVGVHTSHITAAHGIASAVACSACHPTVTGVNDAGHMNGSVEFNSSNITSYAGGSCTSSCHKGNSVSWTAIGYLTGLKSHDCAMCHGAPPATAAHTQGVIDDYTARGFAACVACHPHVNTDGSFNNPSLHMNGAVDAISSGGGNCASCHTTLAAMTSDTNNYHHVLASTAADYTGNTCLKCHVDHNIFQVTQNAANTVGVSANLRVDNSAAAPQVGDAPGSSYTNTDFVDSATNGGICISCHQNNQTKNLTAQKYASPYINTTTMVVVKSQYTPSMHNYTTSSTFGKDSSKFLANCSKCHSDSMAETKQSGTKTFGLHLSKTRDLFTPFGAATPSDAREDRLCYGCHSQTTDNVGAGQSAKPVNGKDWYGSRTMRPSAEDTFKSFSSSTRVFRHNVGKYNGLHNANENQTYLGQNKHVECADCHNSHGATFGTRSSSFAAIPRGQRALSLANVMKGATGVVPTYGSSSAGLPGVTGTTLYFKNTSPGTPTIRKNTDTPMTVTQFQSQNMSATTGSTAATQVITIPTATVASTNFMGTAFVSPPMTAGTLPAQTVTLNMYATASSSSSPNRARLKAYLYLWDGTTATQLGAVQTSSGYIATTKANMPLTWNISSTTVPGNSQVVCEVYVITGTSATTAAMTATLSYGNATDISNLAFTTGPVWNTASGYTSQPATQEFNVCIKCHSKANSGWFKNMTSAGQMGGKSKTWTDLSMEFNPNNKSFHPVVSALNGVGSGSSTLTSTYLNNGWKPGDMMTCTDCHATDSTASKGPHGSSVKWMLAGVNKAWPYTSAASNGATSGTYFAMSNKTTGLGTNNGLFCMNCHTVTSTNGFHVAVNGFSTHQGFAMNCVSCHIRVPHGGKISRLLNTVTNVPARYMGNGNGANAAGSASITKFSKVGAAAPGGNFTCSGGTHSGGTESW